MTSTNNEDASYGYGVAVCYLCFDGELDDSNQPLRRDCSCRGTDAGFVHLKCLADYAAVKSMRWDGRDIVEFRKSWEECPQCLQNYQNELRIDISTKFVSFVRGQYPRDTQMQVESLNVKLAALNDNISTGCDRCKRGKLELLQMYCYPCLNG